MKCRCLSSIALFALASHAADLPGRYVLRGVTEVGSELLLNANGTFEYMLVYGAADYQAKGSWKQDGGSVVLNTAGGGEAPFRMVRSAPAAGGAVRVWVRTAGGAGVQHIDVVLETADGTVKGRTANGGDAEFTGVHDARSVKLHVPVYDIEGGPYDLNPAHREFFFEINGEAITRVPFKNERLNIVEGALEMRFWNPERPMLYRRGR